MGVKLLDGRKDSFNEKDTLFDDQTDRFIQVAEGVNFSIIDILFLDYPSVLQLPLLIYIYNFFLKKLKLEQPKKSKIK